jgi:predicted nucleic acid-binding protein
VGAVSVYLDVNVIVALFAVDSLNDRADQAMRGVRDTVVVSNLSAAEFSAVIARRVRTRDLRAGEARTAFANFDNWCVHHTALAEIDGRDVAGATALMRRLDFPLRTPDALHIAIVQRTGSALLTFDRTMATVARALGVAIAKPAV